MPDERPAAPLPGGVPDGTSESDWSALERVRREKLARLRAAGVDPYPVGFARSHTLAEVARHWPDLAPGQESGDVVRVAGRIVLKRDFGRLAFWTLRHGGDELQAMLTVDSLGPDQLELVTDLDAGDWVGVQGEVVRTWPSRCGPCRTSGRASPTWRCARGSGRST